ncbi:MAG TPA: MBL fold metallo-hydrolase [Candidatus Polarisedimenticolaceae bacterium]|nr:MBL fold metallo-hydrolase [Candidatus Polarisedimenticolaceae bacterium]
MRLTFHGAAGQVTGSCTSLEHGGARILVDCGAFQGPARLTALNRRRFTFPPRSVAAVVLTHAHVDHIGRLPLLTAQGFRGPIYCTAGTADLVEIMLLDSARIHERDAEEQNAWRLRAGRPAVKPLFTEGDVARILERLETRDYGVPFEVGRTAVLRVTFRDAGHILGSASVLLERDGHRILFSGDIGPRDQPIVRDPEPAPPCDVLVIESTYGDREHPRTDVTDDLLLKVLEHARADGGALLIPAFAVGRTQNVLYRLKTLSERKKLVFPEVYLDSPLAIRATEIYRAHPECFDEEARARLEAGSGLVWMSELRVLKDRQDSIALNRDNRPKIVVAASGMCTAGPILHHLRHHLWRPEADVLFAGYQAEGTLGRKILDGAKHVRIHDRPVQVRASIHQISGLSAHTDRKGLRAWAESAGSPKKIFVNHGEAGPAAAMAESLRAVFPGAEINLPQLEEGFEL